MRKIPIWLLISAYILSVMNFAYVYGREQEEIIGQSNVAHYDNGKFYEYMTKELVYEHIDDPYVEYIIRYRIHHEGGGYTYQSGAVELYVDNIYQTTFQEQLYVRLNNVDMICGEMKVRLTKGEEHILELRDVHIDHITSINVKGEVFHGFNHYEVQFYDGFDNLLESQYVLHNKGAIAPGVPIKEGYVFIGWNCAFDRIVKPIQVQAMWELETTIQIQDRYFIKGEKVNVQQMTSQVFSVNEKNERGKEGLQYSGLQQVDTNRVGTYPINVTYTHVNQPVKQAVYTIHVIDVIEDYFVREISAQQVNTLSVYSKWNEQKEVLSAIINKQNILNYSTLQKE